ncbi:MAG: bifunctional diaminohydroxyphosphoribosylaminopyrimidine deaminase/5-amino-6-(5-phosphoribosylamino)uracil reductase RibD [Nitrospirota bacterium]|nr:MAG: bifunctional diaminohydroxyphosphoribosylaminopyrimidine deaminase/5-amino-6-(5-phosphoribosylamino)uracil reductase RibD [Nitrospirota bacterium]
MKRAIVLARRAEGRTSPNPLVGSLLVKNGHVISEGYHKKAGMPHAEAEAIGLAGKRANGSTLYVNLEPCCHKDKRTPPCTSAIINAGIKKVVIGMQDPNPKVSGKGIKYLRSKGIEVVEGVLKKDAERLNEFYIKYIITGKPFVLLKTAMTLDGKIATPTGESKWITSERSRQYVHRMRSKVDAVLSAIGTVKADDPLFTARIKGARDPMRIIIDPELDVDAHANILQCPPETLIITKTKGERVDRLSAQGIKFMHYDGTLDMNDLLRSLGKLYVTSIMIEGGSSLAGHALGDGIVDKVMYFIAPKIIGGSGSYPAVGGNNYRDMKDAIAVRDMKVRRIDQDLLIEGYL